MKLGDRYALVETDPGALMLDLVSGVIFELNESGKAIWQLALAGESETSIAAVLAQRHALDMNTARQHVRDALEISLDGVPEPPPTVFNYTRHGREYVFSFRGEAVLVVDDRGERIRSVNTPDGVSLSYLLQAIAPKVLALRGQAVLHASAVTLGGYALAFSGWSGAGKTSVARAFVRAGAQILCEDKLRIQLRDAATVVAPLGENEVGRWVAETAKTLSSSQDASCAGLDLGMERDVMPLAEIGFLEAQRRTHGPYASRALSGTETAAAAFRNAFYGSDENRDWIRQLHMAAHIGHTVRGFALTVPNGLDRLAETAAALAQSGSLRS